MDGKILTQSATKSADFMFDLQRFDATTWTLTKETSDGTTTYKLTATGKEAITSTTSLSALLADSGVVAGDIIQLGSEISETVKITIPKNLTLDLNGKTLNVGDSSKEDAEAGIIVQDNMTFTVKDSGTGGKINYTNKSDTHKKFGAIQIGTTLNAVKSTTNDTDNHPKYDETNATLNIESGTITGNGSAIVAGDKSTINISGGTVESTSQAGIYFGPYGRGGSTLTMEGGTIRATGEEPAIQVSGNVDATATTLDIKGNSLIQYSNSGEGASNENNNAIYAAGITDLKVSGNAKITSTHVAIEIRGGKLEVESGTTIESTAQVENGVAYHAQASSGSTTDKGAAIVVAQHSHRKNLDVDIKGGTISGYTALLVTNAKNITELSGTDLEGKSKGGSGYPAGEYNETQQKWLSGRVTVDITGGTLKSTSQATADSAEITQTTDDKNLPVYHLKGKNAIVNDDERVTVNILNATIEGSIASSSREGNTDNDQNTTGYKINAATTDFTNFTYSTEANLLTYKSVTAAEKTIGSTTYNFSANVLGVAGWNKAITDNTWEYKLSTGAENTTPATLTGSDSTLTLAVTGNDSIPLDMTAYMFKSLAYETINASRAKAALNITANDKIKTLTGGEGNDTFILNSGSVTVTNYTTGDKIQFASAKSTDAVEFTKEDGKAVVTCGETSFTLENAAELIEEDENGLTYILGSTQKTFAPLVQIGNNVYTSFDEALADVQDGDTIKLLKNVEVANGITVDKALTFDFGDKTLTGAVTVESGGSLTLASGTIKQTVTNNGTFNMTGGTIETESGSGIINNGTLNLRGGKINSKNGRGVNNATANSYFNMFSGSVFGKVGIKMFAGFLKLLGGRVHGRSGGQGGQNVVESDSIGEPVTYNANAETEETNSGVGIDVANDGSAEVTVGDKNNKGDIQVSGETTALEISGSGTSTVNLNDGKYTAGQADDDGNITVDSNSNSIKYNSSNNANKLTVDGAILESKVDTGSANVGGSDTATDGSANQIVINSVAVAPAAKTASQNNGKDTAFTKLLTTTANFNGENDYAFAGTASDFFAVRVTITSSGQNITEGQTVVEYNADTTNPIVTNYGSIQDAVNKVNKDGGTETTIELLKDATTQEVLNISKDGVTLNFGNYTLTYMGSGNAAISLGSNATTFTVDKGDNLVNGGIQVTDSNYTIKSGIEDFGRLRLTTSGADSVFFYNFDSAMNRLGDNETLTYDKAVTNFTTLGYNKEDGKEFRIEGLSSSNGISITGGESKNISLTTSNFSNASVASGGTNYTFYLSDRSDTTGSGKSFTGSAGDDKIVNASKQLSVFGGAGNDSLVNSAASATIDGGEGDDSITNTGASASLFGGDGNDSIVNNETTTGGVTLNGGAGDDLLKGSSKNDTFIYSGGSDTIDGTNYDNGDTVSLEGFSPITDGLKLASLGASKFALNFGTGDSLTFNVASASIMSGSGTASTYVYTPTAISLKGSNNNDSVTLGASYDSDGFDGSSTFTHIVATAVQTLPSGKEYFSIKGGSSANYIVGSDYVATSIMGGTGKDTLKAGAKAAVLNGGTNGSDTFIGGAGADSIIASGESAYINGGLGQNLITLSGSKNATIDATAGTDLINIGSGVTTFSLKGFSENDTLQFSSAVTSIGTTNGGISLKAGDASITVQGFPTGGTSQSWSFNDDVASYASVENKLASTGVKAWTYVGGESKAITFNGTTKTTGSNLFAIKGLANTDGSSVNTTNKVVSLSASNFGADGVSVVSNSGYAFSLTGGDYSGKTFAGSAVADTIYNSISNIYINGGNGADSLENKSGENVTLAGGAGNDTLVGSSSAAETFVYNGEGNDSIGGYSAGDIIMTTLTPITNVSKFTVDSNNYVFNFGSNSSLTVASASDVPVSVRKSGDTDTYAYTSDKVSKNGTAVTLTAAVGANKYTAADTETSIDASAVTVSTTIEGNAKDNYIIGSATKAGSLLGGVGSDSLYAGKMGAYLDGGDDGNDLLVGADGVDTFVYRGGKDTIQSYSSGDIVSVVGDSFTLPTTFTATTTPSLSYDNSNYVLNFDTGNSLTFQAKNSFSIVKGNDTYSYEIDSIALNNTTDNKHGITLGGAHHTSKTFRGDSTANSAYVTINASEVDHVITVRGNDNANLIHGGSKGGTLLGGNKNDTLVAGAVGTYLNGGDENDSLVGGNGNDTFAYTSGNDIIKSYTQDLDLVSVASSIDIASATVTTATGSGTTANLVIAFDDAGSLTFEEGASSTISLKSGKKYYTFSASSIASAADKSITLTANFNSSSFDAGEDYNNIDASAVSLATGISIKGNDNGNYIIGSASQASSLVGGKGDDTFKGGEGNDVFFYEAGKDVIIGFNEGTSDTDRLSITTDDIVKAKASSRKLTFTMNNKANTLVFRATDAAPTQISLSSNEGYLTKDGVVSLPSSTKSLKLFSSAKGRIDLNNDTLYSSASIASVSAAAVEKQSVTLVGGSNQNATFTFATNNKKRDGFEYNGGKVTIGNYESGKDKLNLGDFTISGFEVKAAAKGQTAGDVVISLGSADNVISLTGAAGSEMLIHQSTNRGNSYSKMVFSETGVVYDKAKAKATSATIWGGLETTTKDGYSAKDDEATKLKKIKVRDEAVTSISIQAGGNNTLIDASLAGAGVSLYSGDKNDKFIGSGEADMFVYTAGKDIIQGFGTGDSISLSGGTANELAPENAKITSGKKSIKFKFEGGSKNTLTIKPIKNETLSGSLNINGKERTYGKNFIASGANVSLTSKFGGTYNLDKVNKNASVSYNNVDGHLVEKKLTFKGTDAAESLVGGQNKTTFKGGGGADSLVGGSGADTFFYAKGDKYTVTIANFDFDNDKLKIAGGTINKIESLGSDGGIQFAMKNGRGDSPAVGWFKVTTSATSSNYDSNGKATLAGTAIAAKDVLIKANNTYYWFAQDTITQEVTTAGGDGSTITVASAGDLITWDKKISASQAKNTNCDIIELNYSTNLVKAGVASVVSSSNALPTK